MNIYQSTKVMPYVYLAVNTKTNEFYYGVRWANKVPSTSDIGIVYKTSSNQIFPIAEQFTFSVIAEFFDAESAGLFEQSLIRENWDNPLLINGNIGGIKYKTSGKRTPEHSQKLVESRKRNNKKVQWTELSKNNASNNPKVLENINRLAKNKIGKPRDAETTKKISKSLTGRKNSEEHNSAISKGSLGKSKSNKGIPKPKTVCRLTDKAEMNISSYWSWIARNPI